MIASASAVSACPSGLSPPSASRIAQDPVAFVTHKNGLKALDLVVKGASSGASKAGGWVQERRDVTKDFQRAFGDISGRLSGLAIASDTDNTSETAHAGFADFRFVAKDEECPAATAE